MTTKQTAADPAAAPVATPEEVAKFRADQETEYGTFVALQTIAFNGAVAYTAGDPVPASNVERHKYLEQGLVAKVTSKEGQALIGSLHAATTTQQTNVEQPAPVSLGVPVA